MAQAPKNMGAFAVENLIKLQKVEPVTDTGTVLVTKENADQFKQNRFSVVLKAGSGESRVLHF